MRWTRSAGRLFALTAGVLLLLPGLGLLGGGGFLLWTDWFSRADGFVVSPEESLGSDGYALVSDRVDLDAGPDWLPLPAAVLGHARIQVTTAEADDVFVGIAPAADAARYLDGVRRTAVDGLGFDGPPRSGDRIPGGEPPGPPEEQGFWTAEATGPGGHHVNWDPADGEWMFVIMNTDGSAGVDVEARIGAELPALAPTGWALSVSGLIVTLLAGLLLEKAVRRPADRRAALAGTPAPAPRVPIGGEPWAPQSAGVDGGGDPGDAREVRRRSPSWPSQQ